MAPASASTCLRFGRTNHTWLASNSIRRRLPARQPLSVARCRIMCRTTTRMRSDDCSQTPPSRRWMARDTGYTRRDRNHSWRRCNPTSTAPCRLESLLSRSHRDDVLPRLRATTVFCVRVANALGTVHAARRPGQQCRTERRPAVGYARFEPNGTSIRRGIRTLRPCLGS